MKQRDKSDKVELKEIKPQKLRESLKYHSDIIVGNMDRIMGEKKITQEQLSESMETDQSHLNKVMRNKRGITLKFLVRTAFSLDVKLIELVR